MNKGIKVLEFEGGDYMLEVQMQLKKLLIGLESFKSQLHGRMCK
jgi:hypothetical protein